MFPKWDPCGSVPERLRRFMVSCAMLFSLAGAATPSNAPGITTLLGWLAESQPDLVRARQEVKLAALPWNGTPPSCELTGELALGSAPTSSASSAVRIEGPLPASVAAAGQAAHAARRRAETTYRLLWIEKYQALRDALDALRRTDEQFLLFRAEQARLRSVMENLLLRRAMGGARERDLDRFRLELAALEQRSLAGEQERVEQSNALELLLGRPIAVMPAADPIKGLPGVEEALRTAVAKRPEQDLLTLARDEVRWASQRRGLAFVPGLGAGVASSSTELGITLAARWDLGALATVSARRSALERQGYAQEHQALTRRISNEVLAAYQAWEISARRVRLSSVSLEKTAALEQDGRLRYQEGLVTLPVFIEEQRALLDQKLSAIETQYELSRAVTRLERQMYAPVRGLERFP